MVWLEGAPRRLGLASCYSERPVFCVEAAPQLFKGAVRVDVDVEHLADDPSVEAFNHTSAGLRRPRLGVAILGPRAAEAFKREREAVVVVGQHVCKAEWELDGCLAQEDDGAFLVSSSLTARWTVREQRSMAE